ncbi:MAG: pyrroline-5-carboxylate reductase, partial [Candidatus Bathyarchaeota archaeon]
MKETPKIAVIGAGKMGEAIIAGLLKSGAYSPKEIQAIEIVQGRQEYITQTYSVKCHDKIKKAVAFGDIIVIAVEPGVVGEILKQIEPALKQRKILISIAAGVTLDYIQSNLPKNIPIVRVMPNQACLVNESMITICPSDNTTEEQVEAVTKFLSLLGKVLPLKEKYLNLATGLVGSGPAYIYLVIEALADAGVRLGMPKDISIILAAQTTLGAAKMVVETGEHPAKLKDKVATPGGTTVEGLLELERGGLRA